MAVRRNVDIITMGCSKNLVDSEHLIYSLGRIGFRAWSNPEKTHGGVAVVNTCGFIEAAKEESVNMILSLVEEKKRGKLDKVIVMGCLSERYRNELRTELPEVDCFYGKFDWNGIIEYLKQEYGVVERKQCSTNPDMDRVLTTPRHYAYVKISEGCDHHCAYCAIPLITGPQRSRSIESICDEVKGLVAAGTKEFQIIAQDSTAYGTDLYGHKALPELISSLSDIEGVEWLRIHYAYPNSFPLELLDIMAERDNVCKYLDIALQHIDDNVLARMRRHITGDEIRRLLETIRRRVPGIALRTTMLVGFPGETDAEFDHLVQFVREERFERLGVFTYSEEDGTYAARHFKDDVPEKVKCKRSDTIMAIQQQISSEICEARKGTVMRVIADRTEGDYIVCRSQYDSPEVDGEVLVRIEDLDGVNMGDFFDVKITAADEYDLYASPVKD